MLQIIGKGGFAREVSSYARVNTSLAEYEEIDLYTDKFPTVIAIGDPKARKSIAEKYPLKYRQVVFGRLSKNCVLGDGCIICPGTVLTTDIKLGAHVIVNLNCTIGHDVRIGDYVTISPGANISGNVTIGNNCYIGSNAVIREGITICDDVIIGAGAVVVKNITEPGTYVGNPSKKNG